MAFIVGCGRSGTHWLAEVLAAHPDVRVTVEKPAIFGPVTRMALDPGARRRRLRRLLLRYRLERARVAPHHYVDKSHPNLWLVEDLARAFPEARFLAIERDPYRTVASMLRHPGARRWCERWAEYPLPNAFLGVTHENRLRYAREPMVRRCARRWLAHAERTRDLAKRMPEVVLPVQYEALLLDPAAELGRIESFLGLRTPLPLPKPDRAALERWRETLSETERDHVADVVGRAPPATLRQGV